MKIIFALGTMLALTGCSVISRPPSEATARKIEAGRVAAERERRIDAEAKRLEQQGLRAMEARALATAQARGGWP